MTVRPVTLVHAFGLWCSWQNLTQSPSTLKKEQHLKHCSSAYSITPYQMSLVTCTLQRLSTAHWNPCFTGILLTVHVCIFQHRKSLDPCRFSRLSPKFHFYGNSFSLTVLLAENFLSSSILSFFCLLMPRNFIMLPFVYSLLSELVQGIVNLSRTS